VDEDKSQVSHLFPLSGALYNREFHQVISCDEGSICCAWDVETGTRVVKFENLHEVRKIYSQSIF